MIILKFRKKIKSFIHISQSDLEKLYSDLVFLIDLSSIECYRCHSSDWAFHARYERSLVVLNHTFHFFIQRIICKQCGKTHAILLDCMVPFDVREADYFIDPLISDVIDLSSSPCQNLRTCTYFSLCFSKKRQWGISFIMFPHTISPCQLYNDLVIHKIGRSLLC